MAEMLSEALDYARRGWYVFPCREKPGEPYVKNGETITPFEKTPYVAQGLNDATIDTEQIKLWWTSFPNAMIGINAGKSGLFVIDIDKKHVNGLDTFNEWKVNDTAGLHSITPSGGMHIVFTGGGKSSTNSKTGIDTRGEGGYFVAPPSKILEGTYVGEYARFDDWGRTPGVIPDGLMGKLFPDKTTEYVRGNATSDVKQLSRASLNFLANGAPAGERNSTLFKVLADFAGCGYSKESAKDTVFPVASRIGLGSSEFVQVLEHAYSKPRTSAIPDSIQVKLATGGKDVVSKITVEEQEIIENALLACLITNNSTIPTVQDILNFEDFQGINNRVIYKAINKVHNEGKKVDYVTVTNQISKETNKINLDAISKLLSDLYVNSDNVATYAEIIKEKASMRKLETVLDNKDKYMKRGNLIEVISSLEKDISDIALYGGVKSTNILDSGQAVEAMSERTRKIMNGEITLLNTGFYQYDTQIGGMFSDDFVLCAARSGDGKSALALTVASHVAMKEAKGVGFFSLEMSTHETICRLICQKTGLPFRNIYQGKLDASEWKQYNKAVDEIKSSKFYFDDSYGITVSELRSKIRKLMEKDIKLVVIDQLEQIQGYEGLAIHVQYDKIAYNIRAMAREFGVPIILNHQLNRGVTDRKLKNTDPILSDLNQAGEKPATQVWVIVHRKDENDKIVGSKIKMLKNRNGARIDFGVNFIGEKMLFANPAYREDTIKYDNNKETSLADFDEDEVPWGS